MDKTIITLQALATGMVLNGWFGEFTSMSNVDYYRFTTQNQYKTLKISNKEDTTIKSPKIINFSQSFDNIISPIDKENEAILTNFITSILDNTKPLDSDFSQFIDEKFWDLV